MKGESYMSIKKSQIKVYVLTILSCSAADIRYISMDIYSYLAVNKEFIYKYVIYCVVLLIIMQVLEKIVSR